jgi:hypothetical protein
MNRARPCWAPNGTRPQVACQVIRQYVYLYGAVSPKDGTCVYMIMPASDTECFQVFLETLAKKYPGSSSCCSCMEPAIITATNSRFLQYHSTSSAALFPRAEPSGNLWDEIREKIFKNYALKSMDVYAKLEDPALYIERKPALVKSITSFPYITKSL